VISRGRISLPPYCVPKIYYTKLVKKLWALTPRLAAFGKFSIISHRPPWWIPLRSVVTVADSAMKRRSRSGFRHAATKIAAGAPLAGIRSQAKRTTAKLESLKFTNENKIFPKK
jgi:hypothetical protein